jgi:hypothetical protein
MALKEWKWNQRRTGEDGVSLYSDHLVWWSENWEAPFAGGGGRDQSFEEFLAAGPVDPDIPLEAWHELLDAVNEIVSRRNP